MCISFLAHVLFLSFQIKAIKKQQFSFLDNLLSLAPKNELILYKQLIVIILRKKEERTLNLTHILAQIKQIDKNILAIRIELGEANFFVGFIIKNNSS